MSHDETVVVSVVAATPGIRIVNAEGAQLVVAEPVIAWEIHSGQDEDGHLFSSVFPVSINGADYEGYGVQYADGTVSGFGTLYESIEEAQADFPNSDA